MRSNEELEIRLAAVEQRVQTLEQCERARQEADIRSRDRAKVRAEEIRGLLDHVAHHWPKS